MFYICLNSFIINATGHEIFRVDVTQSLDAINIEIDIIVQKLKVAKATLDHFTPWNIEEEQNYMTYISRGYIDLKDDVAFKTVVDAANCFGKSYKSIQKGAIKHPKEEGKYIWFPKLYRNAGWDNSISDDETEIREKCLESTGKDRYSELKEIHSKHIVFAKVKSPLGDIMYRFKGEYEVVSAEKSTQTRILKRINERVKTYSAT